MLSVFINYLDYRTESNLSKFVNYTRLVRTVKYTGVQGFSSERPQQAGESHQVPQNQKQTPAPGMGQPAARAYIMGNDWSGSCFAEKYLWVLVDKFNVSQQLGREGQQHPGLVEVQPAGPGG